MVPPPALSRSRERSPASHPLCALRGTGAFYWPGTGLPPAWGKANGDLVLSEAVADDAEDDTLTWRRGAAGQARAPHMTTRA